jgi:hypothetical protein
MGADHVVLTDGSFDSEGMIGYVGGERSVRQVHVGVAARVHGDGELDFGYHQCGYSPGGPHRFAAGHEGGGLAAFVGEQVAGVDAACGAGGRDLVSGQEGVQFA